MTQPPWTDGDRGSSPPGRSRHPEDGAVAPAGSDGRPSGPIMARSTRRGVASHERRPGVRRDGGAIPGGHGRRDGPGASDGAARRGASNDGERMTTDQDHRPRSAPISVAPIMHIMSSHMEGRLRRHSGLSLPGIGSSVPGTVSRRPQSSGAEPATWPTMAGPGSLSRAVPGPRTNTLPISAPDWLPGGRPRRAITSR